MKKLVAMISALLVCLTALAQRDGHPRHVAARLEWGAAGGFFMAKHFNYISSEGYRVNDAESGLAGAMNAYVLAGVQTSVGSSVDLSVCVGLDGIWSGRRSTVVAAIADWCPRGVTEDGPLVNVAAGVGVHSFKPLEMQALARLGGGYRFALGNRSSVDFLASIRGVWDHPSVRDSDTGAYVTGQDVRRNNAVYVALTLSVALNF